MGKNAFELQLKDGKTAVCRFLTPDNLDGLIKFIKELPEDVRLLLPFDPLNESEFTWFLEGITFNLVSILVAECHEQVVGFGLIRKLGYGWAQHVGEILVLISSPYRHQNLGTQIVKQLVAQARSMGVEKLYGHIPARLTSVVAAFEHAGFARVGVLKNFARDTTGLTGDVVLLTRDIVDLWNKVEDFYHFTGRSMEH